MRYLAVAVVLLGLAVRTEGQARAEKRDGKVFLTNEAPVALSPDDAAVLAVAIGNAHLRKGIPAGGTYLLADRTLGVGEGCNWIRSQGLSAEALREVKARNETGRLLPKDAVRGVRLVEEWRVPAWFKWEKVSNLYPEASVLLRVGLPGYSADRRGCLLMLDVLYAGGWERTMLLLQRHGDSWVVSGESDASCVHV